MIQEGVREGFLEEVMTELEYVIGIIHTKKGKVKGTAYVKALWQEGAWKEEEGLKGDLCGWSRERGGAWASGVQLEASSAVRPGKDAR